MNVLHRADIEAPQQRPWAGQCPGHEEDYSFSFSHRSCSGPRSSCARLSPMLLGCISEAQLKASAFCPVPCFAPLGHLFQESLLAGPLPTSSSSPPQPGIHRECKCSMNCDFLGISSLSHDKQVQDRDLDLRSQASS